MKLLIALAAFLALTGCSLFQTKPEIVTVVKEVPVPVACVEQVPVEPDYVHDTLDETYALDVLYEAALLDLKRAQKYALDLRVEVVTCSKIPKL